MTAGSRRAEPRPGRGRPGARPVLLLVAGLGGCASTEPAAPPCQTASGPTRVGDRLPAAGECAIDRDCVLLPEVTCCGECPPAPPFEVGPIEALDAILIEAEARCALETRSCDAAPACAPVPPTCTARAGCVAGACVVIEHGCGDAVL